MTPEPISRRTLLALTAGAGLAALAACRDGGNGEPSESSIDVAFAEPWRTLWSEDMRALATAAALTDPDALDHARDRLAVVTDATSALATAVQQDVEADQLRDVNGWLLPRTFLGLAMGLALLDR